MRKFFVSALAFIALLAGGWSFSGYLASKKESPPERPKPEVINYVKAIEYQPSDIQTEVEAFGRIGSSQTLNLTTEVGGRLIAGSISFKEGQNFKKGQLICRIYNAEQRLSLQARKSTFLNLLASILPDLKIDFPDSFNAWQQYFDTIDLEKDLPDLPKMVTTKEKTFLATKNVLGEFYNIKSLEENLRKYYVYAPYTGSISAVNVEVGSIVNPGTVVGSIIRTDQLELVIPIELRDISFLETGKTVTVQGQNDKSWRGQVVRIADLVDPTTQSVNAFISVQNPKRGEIYDGLYLKAVIPGKIIANAMSISRSILRNKNEVFIVQNGVLRSRKVNVEKISGENAIISGLEAGDLLVIDAPANASNNMKVSISEKGTLEEVPDRREL